MKTKKQEKPVIILIWGMIAGGAAQGIMGQGFKSADAYRDYVYYNKTAQDNQRREKEMSQHYYDLSMKKWNDTNYPAQVRQMEKAGLNVGLMYGSAGQGGQATSQTPSPQGGEKLSQSENVGMGMQVGLQAQRQKAEIDLLKAQTTKTEVESTKIGGIDTELAGAQKRTETQRSGLVMQEAIKAAEEVVRLSRENQIGEETMQNMIKGIAYDTIGKELENQLKKKQITKTTEETRKIWHEIWQNWIKTGALTMGSLGTVLNMAFKNLNK